MTLFTQHSCANTCADISVQSEVWEHIYEYRRGKTESVYNKLLFPQYEKSATK